MSIKGFDERMARERRARLQAERLLAQRSEELYAANRKLAEHAHALSHTVIAQRAENAALIGRSSRTQAALEVATEKAVIAERRLWDALSAVEDGFAIFDRDWRLVVGNPAWMGAFDGISDVSPGASYEAILRIAVEEGLIDLQGEGADDWVDRMIARWEGQNIPQTDIRLFNGVYVRLIDKRTPQGDVTTNPPIRAFTCATVAAAGAQAQSGDNAIPSLQRLGEGYGTQFDGWSFITTNTSPRCWVIPTSTSAFKVFDVETPGSDFVDRTATGTGTGPGAAHVCYVPAHNAAYVFGTELGATVRKLTISSSNPLTASYAWSDLTNNSGSATPANVDSGSYQGTNSKAQGIVDMGNGQAALVIASNVQGPTYVYKLPA
jgi:hypothetical protein